MESKFYQVNRDDIYVGKVIKLSMQAEPYRRWEIKSDICKTGLIANAYKPLRSILFTPTYSGYANDLLYDSPLYPALNIADTSDCLKPYKNTVVAYCCHLSQLLEYLGFNEKLTFKDIEEIRKTIFAAHWAQDNCQMFGFTEKVPLETDYLSLKSFRKAQAQYEKERSWGMRCFVPSENPNTELSREYFHCLNAFGDSNFKEVLFDLILGLNSKTDAFRPSKSEISVKALSINPIKHK